MACFGHISKGRGELRLRLRWRALVVIGTTVVPLPCRHRNPSCALRETSWVLSWYNIDLRRDEQRYDQEQDKWTGLASRATRVAQGSIWQAQADVTTG